MNFFSIRTAPVRSTDVVFRESWKHKAGGAGVGLILFVGPLVAAWVMQSWIPVFIAPFGLLFFLLMLSSMRKARGPANWLVRCQSGGMLIKMRSYLNDRFPADDLVVFYLSREEVEWIRRTKQRVLQPSGHNDTKQIGCEYLDIKAKTADLTELELRLKEERARPPMGDRMRVKAHDYPVRIIEGGIIQITWRSEGSRVVPSLQKAMAFFAKTMGLHVAQEQSECLDLVSDPRDRDRQEENILALIERGNMAGATHLARKFYGCSLGEARKFVEELAGK